jgi:hypothetical protein
MFSEGLQPAVLLKNGLHAQELLHSFLMGAHMKHTEAINDKIRQENGAAVSTLFKLDQKASRRILESAELDKVDHPFNILLEKQRTFLEAPSLNSARELLGSAELLYEAGDWASLVIKRIVHGAFKMCSSGDTEALAKILFEMCKRLISGRSESSLYVANILFKLYFDIGRFKLAENLLLIVSEPEKRDRDFYVFNFYKGLINGLRDNFATGHMALKTAFGYKRIRKAVAPPYFLLSLLVGRYPKAEYLRKYECGFMAELTTAMRKGLYTHVSSIVDRHADKLGMLYRVAAVYCPMACFNNLVMRVYQLRGNDHRLSIERLMELLDGLEYGEIVCLLSSVIEMGRLKGYVSVNRGVIVFSKVDPFPSLA